MERPIVNPKSKNYNGFMAGESSEPLGTVIDFESAKQRLEQKGKALERIEGMEARLAYLRSLPAEGFKSEDEKEQTIEQIARIGLPIENYNKLLSKRNKRGREENVLATWGTGSRNYGEFSRYDLLDKEVPQKQNGTLGHEGMHGASPFDARNTLAYKTPEARRQAQEVAIAIAEQTDITGIPLNGYHKWLLEEMRHYEKFGVPRNKDKQIIDRAVFYEETHAIAGELGLSNRNRLIDMQREQHKKMDDLIRIGEARREDKVDLITTEDRRGNLRVGGIDTTLIHLVDGVNSYEDLVQHVASLKERYYPDEDFAKAQTRDREILRFPVNIKFQMAA